MWENSGVIPRRDMLLKVADFFGVSTDFLLGSAQEGKLPVEDKEVQIIQRGLKGMNAEQHKKALKILAAAFDDIFDDDGFIRAQVSHPHLRCMGVFFKKREKDDKTKACKYKMAE